MGDIISWLAGWYNWPFLLTLFIGILFILADVFLGGVSDIIGVDADADVDVDSPEVDADANGPDVAAARAGNFFLSGLAWVGLGKVPISVLLQIMTISFGLTGLLVNAVAGDFIPGGSTYVFPVALIASAVVAPLVTSLLGTTIAKIIPADATTSRKPSEFQGEVGITASVVTDRIGQVRLEATDDHPSTVLNARCHDSVAGDIARDQEVLLIGYDADKNIYLVTPTNLEL